MEVEPLAVAAEPVAAVELVVAEVGVLADFVTVGVFLYYVL